MVSNNLVSNCFDILKLVLSVIKCYRNFYNSRVYVLADPGRGVMEVETPPTSSENREKNETRQKLGKGTEKERNGDITPCIYLIIKLKHFK